MSMLYIVALVILLSIFCNLKSPYRYQYITSSYPLKDTWLHIKKILLTGAITQRSVVNSS